MRTFAETAEKIASTTKKLEKTGLLAEYLKSVPVEEAAVAAAFFSRRPFPSWEEKKVPGGGKLPGRAGQEHPGGQEQETEKAHHQDRGFGAVGGALLAF